MWSNAEQTLLSPGLTRVRSITCPLARAIWHLTSSVSTSWTELHWVDLSFTNIVDQESPPKHTYNDGSSFPVDGGIKINKHRKNCIGNVKKQPSLPQEDQLGEDPPKYPAVDRIPPPTYSAFNTSARSDILVYVVSWSSDQLKGLRWKLRLYTNNVMSAWVFRTKSSLF